MEDVYIDFTEAAKLGF